MESQPTLPSPEEVPDSPESPCTESGDIRFGRIRVTLWTMNSLSYDRSSGLCALPMCRPFWWGGDVIDSTVSFITGPSGICSKRTAGLVTGASRDCSSWLVFIRTSGVAFTVKTVASWVGPAGDHRHRFRWWLVTFGTFTHRSWFFGRCVGDRSSSFDGAGCFGWWFLLPGIFARFIGAADSIASVQADGATPHQWSADSLPGQAPVLHLTRILDRRLGREGPFVAKNPHPYIGHSRGGCAFRCITYRESGFGAPAISWRAAHVVKLKYTPLIYYRASMGWRRSFSS